MSRKLENTPPGAEAGTRYGSLVVLRVAKFGRKAEVECRCDCTEVELRRLDALKRAVKQGREPACKSCVDKLKSSRGLARFEPERYMGRRYGRLLVTGVDVDPTRAKAKSRLVCRCDCGGQAVVQPMNLITGRTTSCGCYHRERQVEVGKENVEHGHTTHGVLNGHTPIYRAWMKILAGVREGWRAGFHRVCHEYDPRWDDFENFLSDFGDIKPNETISRRNNQQPWSRENCFVNIGRRSRGLDAFHSEPQCQAMSKLSGGNQNSNKRLREEHQRV